MNTSPAPASRFEPLEVRPAFDLTLKYPFKLDGVDYREISFRRPTRDELVAMGDGKGKAPHVMQAKLYASLSLVPPDVFGFMDPEDAAAIDTWFMGVVDPNGQLSGTGGG